MAKVPDSSKSESWTARIPNDLADLARDKAISLGMLKLGGKPNTTLIIHAALRAWLELPNDISNSVSNNTSNDLSYDVIQVLESRLDELTNVISNTVKREELDTFKTEVLQDVELMIAASVNTQAVVNHAIASPEIAPVKRVVTDSNGRQISYEISKKDKDGSIAMRSVRGISIDNFKNMSKDELKEIGLFKKRVGEDEKFFPTTNG